MFIRNRAQRWGNYTSLFRWSNTSGLQNNFFQIFIINTMLFKLSHITLCILIMMDIILRNSSISNETIVPLRQWLRPTRFDYPSFFRFCLPLLRILLIFACIIILLKSTQLIYLIILKRLSIFTFLII